MWSLRVYSRSNLGGVRLQSVAARVQIHHQKRGISHVPKSILNVAWSLYSVDHDVSGLLAEVHGQARLWRGHVVGLAYSAWGCAQLWAQTWRLVDYWDVASFVNWAYSPTCHWGNLCKVSEGDYM